ITGTTSKLIAPSELIDSCYLFNDKINSITLISYKRVLIGLSLNGQVLVSFEDGKMGYLGRTFILLFVLLMWLTNSLIILAFKEWNFKNQ
ncbi:hypothetical protein KO489_01350, partial [Reinekea forsetii]|nr:hypothetical protein [Reinekea forsetii]